MGIASKKLRVAMIAPDFPMGETINGGIQGVTLFLGQSLRKSGEIDLDIVFPFAPAEAIGLKNVHGLNVHALKRNRSAVFLDPVHYLKVMKAIQKLSPDIVHIQGHAIWSKWCPIPNIVTIHGIAERDVLYKGSFVSSRLKYLLLWLFEGRARKHASNIIAISPYVKNYLGNRQQNVWDIPNPVGDAFFNIERRPIPHRIFSASHITGLKNTMSLIKAFAQIAAHDAHAELRLAGSGQNSSYGLRSRELISTLGLEGRVHFLGLLPLKDIQHELSLADCFALCSYQENAPVAVAEAMAAGVPVVASNVGGIPWMVGDGTCGKLVDPKDTSSIVDGLETVLFSKHNREFGAVAKQRAETFYKSHVVAQKTIQAYLQVRGSVIQPRFSNS